MTALLLLALALDVAWQGVRAIAWHGWGILELAAALGVLAVVAGALSDTAKAYSTEKRVNELTRRHWTQVHVVNRQAANDTARHELSWKYTIPANTAKQDYEYEFYVEGDGTWGSVVLNLHIYVGAGEFATCAIGAAFAGAGVHFSWWARGTVSLRGEGTAAPIVVALSGAMEPSGNDLPGNTLAFGAVVQHDPPTNPRTMNTTIANDFYLQGHWQTVASTGDLITSYKTRITRMGGG